MSWMHMPEVLAKPQAEVVFTEFRLLFNLIFPTDMHTTL